MKKLVSIVLALITIFAISIPGFASFYPPAKKCDSDKDCYVIYNIHGYDTPYFGYSKEDWDTWDEYDQKLWSYERSIDPSIFPYCYGVMLYVVPQKTMEEIKKYSPEELVNAKIVNIEKQEYALYNYDKIEQEAYELGQIYNAKNGYSPIGTTSCLGERVNYYVCLIYVYEMSFDDQYLNASDTPEKPTKPGEKPTKPGEKPTNSFFSFFTAIINAIKNFFNSILNIFKK